MRLLLVVRIGFALTVLVACSGTARVAPTRSPASSEHPRCAVADRDVALGSLGLLAISADARVVFAEIHHATRARFELPPGSPSDVAVEVETATLRLHAFSEASATVFYPRAPSLFGDQLVPLATNHLDWREVRDDRVLVTNGREPGTYTHIDPEWRACSYLSLRPQPPFEIRDNFGPRQRRLALREGLYLVRTSPASRDSRVSIRAGGDHELWLLEQSGTWARVLWQGAQLAVVGWLDLRDDPDPGLGHGSGTGSSVRTLACPTLPLECDADLPLAIHADGHRIEIGSLVPGAAFATRATNGDDTEVVPCDRDVTFVVPIFSRTRAIARCHPRRPP